MFLPQMSKPQGSDLFMSFYLIIPQRTYLATLIIQVNQEKVMIRQFIMATADPKETS